MPPLCYYLLLGLDLWPFISLWINSIPVACPLTQMIALLMAEQNADLGNEYNSTWVSSAPAVALQTAAVQGSWCSSSDIAEDWNNTWLELGPITFTIFKLQMKHFLNIAIMVILSVTTFYSYFAAAIAKLCLVGFSWNEYFVMHLFPVQIHNFLQLAGVI